MQQAQEPGKRIVSKGVYASHVSRKATLSSSGITLCTIGGTGLIIACLITLLVMVKGFSWQGVFLIIAFDLIVGSCSAALVRYGLKAVREARDIAPVVPLTRANTADLPAPDSLVRASQQPTQEQEVTLLRAAAQGFATPIEQLVRPTEQQD